MENLVRHARLLSNVEWRWGLIRALVSEYLRQPAGKKTCLDLIPILARKRVHCLLLETLLALGQSLIPVQGATWLATGS